MSFERIAPRILRVPPENEPLSSDAFIIEGDAQYYVYDVGASDAAYETIAALDKPVTVILSHFHRDHTANMARILPICTYVGARTRKQLGLGTLVDTPVILRDGVEILVQPCVSPHAPGCLIATVDGAYTLVGDLHYGQPDKGAGEARGMRKLLRTLPTQHFIVSHASGSPIVKREAFLCEIEVYYGIK